MVSDVWIVASWSFMRETNVRNDLCSHLDDLSSLNSRFRKEESLKLIT